MNFIGDVGLVGQDSVVQNTTAYDEELIGEQTEEPASMFVIVAVEGILRPEDVEELVRKNMDYTRKSIAVGKESSG